MTCCSPLYPGGSAPLDTNPARTNGPAPPGLPVVGRPNEAREAARLPVPGKVPPGEAIARDRIRLKGAIDRALKFADDMTGAEPLPFCLDLIWDTGPVELRPILAGLPPACRDHAIATLYTRLIGTERREQLGAYFTPPALVEHVLWRLQAAGFDIRTHTAHEPAAGGAAFTMSLARRLVAALREDGEPDAAILQALARIGGTELDPGLATLANALLRRMLIEGFGIAVPADFALVARGDSLTAEPSEPWDVIVGNPPFRRLGQKAQTAWRPRFADIASGRLNLYAMFVRQGLNRLRPGGLLAMVLPTSFLGGPEFHLFRHQLVEMADVLVLDPIAEREGVFDGAVQDACVLVLRRRGAEAGERPVPACARVTANGRLEDLGAPVISADGGPWRLPLDGVGGFRLADYGYRVTVGHLDYAKNEKKKRYQLSSRRAAGSWPLVWAKAVRPDGSFDFERGAEHKGEIWISVEPDAPYLFREPVVVIQRTSNSKQARRLNAATVPQSFIDVHGGVVGENHVLLLVPTEPKVPVELMTRLISSRPVNQRFAAMSGSVSVSARLLAEVDLPDPARVAAIAATDDLDAAISRLYRGLEPSAPAAAERAVADPPLRRAACPPGACLKASLPSAARLQAGRTGPRDGHGALCLVPARKVAGGRCRATYETGLLAT